MSISNLIEYKLNIEIDKKTIENKLEFFNGRVSKLVIVILMLVSASAFYYYYQNGLGLAYNDARSHLDIGRRVVEGLKPGVAQLGSVWLPLPHVLMMPTVWNDFMWHSGLSGALGSMAAFVATGYVIYSYLRELGVGNLGRIVGVLIFIMNINVLYLQSTAMTELLILFTVTVGSYELMMWHKNENILHLIKAAFWIMLSTLTRYDGWFLLFYSTILILLHILSRKEDKMPTPKNTRVLKIFAFIRRIVRSIKINYTEAEGTVILYLTLASAGVFLWLLWNLIIFDDPLYFVFGPFSARTQQIELENAGNLPSKGNLFLSTKIYFYALMFNSGGFIALLGFFSAIVMWFSKKIPTAVKLASSALFAPLAFNVIALYMGHSVLFIQGISGNTWFNVRYGVMLMPAFAIFIGYLVDKLPKQRNVIIGLLAFVTFFAFFSRDAVTIDDARVGSSQKNVAEVSGWLAQNAKNENGFVLISAASHDAIIFSSGLPMKKFIHEGTGLYWESATALPDRWARWIIMRTHDDNDLTFRLVKETKGFEKYNLVDSFPFADIYELKPEYLGELNTEATLYR